MCLAGTVVASLSLTQEVVGWQVWPSYCNDKYFCHCIQQFQWKHLGKIQLNCFGGPEKQLLSKFADDP